MPSFTKDGVELYFEDMSYGGAPDALPVVLGHSFLCNGYMWGPVLPTLSAIRRVVNVDLRGHGQSAPCPRDCTMDDLVGDVLAVLDELGIARAILGGLSIGGMTAMRLAVAHPDRVGGLILLNTDAGAELATKKLKYRALASIVQLTDPKLVVPQITPLMFGRTTLLQNPTLVGQWEARWANMDVLSTVKVLEALLDRSDATAAVRNIDCPTLVVHGAEDAAIGRDRCIEVARLISGSAFQTVEDAGHLVTLERPEAISALLGTFLPALP